MKMKFENMISINYHLKIIKFTYKSLKKTVLRITTCNVFFLNPPLVFSSSPILVPAFVYNIDVFNF